MRLAVDEQFFVLMNGVAQCMPAMANLLRDSVERSTEGDVRIAPVATMEREAAKRVRAVMDRLTISFATPLDSEDIARLANHLANVVRAIGRVVDIRHVVGAPADSRLVLEFATILLSITERLSEAVAHLSEPRRLLADIELISPLEKRAHELYELGLRALFGWDAEERILEVTKTKAVLDRFDAAFCACVRARTTIEGIGVKYL